MYKRVGVSLPSKLCKDIEIHRKKLKMTRSGFFKLMCESYLGYDRLIENKFVRKFAEKYKACAEEEKEMLEDFSKIRVVE